MNYFKIILGCIVALGIVLSMIASTQEKTGGGADILGKLIAWGLMGWLVYYLFTTAQKKKD